MTMKAKYQGTCNKCGQKIMVGDDINWEKGKGAAHVECPKETEIMIPAELSVIEYLTGYGSFGPCFAEAKERTDEFIGMAAKYNNITAEEVNAGLKKGEEVTFDYVMDSGSYVIRDKAITKALREKNEREAKKRRAVQNAGRKFMRCQSCGQTGYAGGYPFSTNPSSGLCDDCF